MTQYLYQPYVFDQDKEYEFIGIGQIVDPKTYKLFCVPNKGGNKGEDAKGWGERYKVRLCFRNSNETNDEDLIDATRNMSFPSGHAGLQIYVPLAPNTFVNIHKNRLFGKKGLCLMENWKMFEIDSFEDLPFCELIYINKLK